MLPARSSRGVIGVPAILAIVAGLLQPTPGPVLAAAGSDGETLLDLGLGRGVDTLRVDPGERRVCLSHRPIFVGSLELEENGERLVPGVHYRVDENAGCLELFSWPPDTLRLLARYRYLPLTIALRYQLRSPEELAPGAAPSPGLPSPAGSAGSDGARLLVGGSKTFVVELGSNRDAVLRQSLDLSIRGQLSRDVELQAVLSDRDSPVTPEGTSSELQELDKVFIQARSRNARATFGDIEVSQSTGEFARYERRLEGMQLEGDWEHLMGGALAANSRGEFRSVEFFGQEGKQGPYRLGDITGEGTVGIVAGSERVLLDGERLARGQSRDYTIDYGLGEITFTPARPITFDSRITIDFESETEDYRRRFAGGNGGYRVEDGFRVQALAISERDDRNSPRGFTLSDDEKAILAEIGDADPVGEAFAVQVVGEGNGDYVSVAADTLAPSYFEWVGPGNGDLLVSFIRVGDRLGAYADSTLSDGTVIFRFVGAGQGDFDPGRRLVRPETQDVGDFQLAWDSERLVVNAELAVSQRDRNTFSSRDDGDNDGLAGLGQVRYNGPRWLDGRGGVSISGRWRHVDADFSPFSRLNPSFDFLSWNYAPGALTEGEDRGQVTVEVEPGDGGTLSLETGRLTSGEVFSADRVAGGYQRTGRLAARLRWEKTWNDSPANGSTGRREVAFAQSSYVLGRFVPTLRYRSEMSVTSGDTTFTGRRFVSGGAEGRFQLMTPLAVGADFSLRVDDRRVARTGNEWDQTSRTRDGGVRLELARVAGVEGRLELRRRTVDPTGPAPAQSTNLARLNLEALPAGGAGRLQLDYQVTTEAIFPRTKVIEFVGDGRGNYDSLGVFVGIGDYDVTITQADDAELLSRLDMAVRGSFLGRSDPSASAIWRQVRASTFARVRQTTRSPFEDLVNPFSGAIASTGPDAVESNLNLRQEVTLFPAERVSPRLRWERTRALDARFENVRELREDDILGLRLTGSPADDWSLSAEGVYERTSDVVERVAPAVAREEDTYETRSMIGEVTHKPAIAWTLTLTGTVSRTESPGITGREGQLELEPVVAWAPGRLGRIEGRVRWVEVTDALPRRRPSFDFGLTNSSGIEWGAIADYRLKDYLTLGGTLRAVRPRGGETLYDGRMELRAFF